MNTPTQKCDQPLGVKLRYVFEMYNGNWYRLLKILNDVKHSVKSCAEEKYYSYLTLINDAYKRTLAANRKE